MRRRSARQAETLARLTGWPLDDIRRKMGPDPWGESPGEAADGRKWWQRLWGN